jgi:uncharacterized protein YycO
MISSFFTLPVRLTVIAAAFLSAFAIAQKAANPSPSASPAVANGLHSGDIVFQDSAPHSGQAEEIKKLTKSKWSHCGIYFQRPDGPIVVEAVGRARKYQPWDAWKASGAQSKVEVRRLRSGLTPEQVDKLWTAAMGYAGRPYDLRFAWGPNEIYCSELVWLAYHDAKLGDVGRLGRLGDFDLSSPEAQRLIVRPGSWGSVEEARRHADMQVISPQAVLDSDRLDSITIP